MAERHAQRHWLKLQAEKAVEIGCTMDEASEEARVNDFANGFGKTADTDVAIAVLKGRHKSALQDAAKSLIRMEILHREIVRRGGKV